MLNVLVEILEILAIVILLWAEIFPSYSMLMVALIIRGTILLIRVHTFLITNRLTEND